MPCVFLSLQFEETCVVLLENLFELGKVSNDDGDKTAQVNLLRSVSSVGVLIARKSPTAPALLVSDFSIQ